MPEVKRVLEFREVDPSDLYNRCVEAFQRVGGKITDTRIESQSPFAGEISAFVPSIWGWGGMRFRAKLWRPAEASRVELVGYIAQLATGPLSKKMDELATELSRLPGQRNLPEPHSPPVGEIAPSEERKWKAADTTMAILVIVGVGGVLLLSWVLRVPDIVLASIAIPVVYYVVRRFLKK